MSKRSWVDTFELTGKPFWKNHRGDFIEFRFLHTRLNSCWTSGNWSDYLLFHHLNYLQNWSAEFAEKSWLNRSRSRSFTQNVHYFDFTCAKEKCRLCGRFHRIHSLDSWLDRIWLLLQLQWPLCAVQLCRHFREYAIYCDSQSGNQMRCKIWIENLCWPLTGNKMK